MATKQEVIDTYRKVVERGEKLAAGLSQEDWQKTVYEGWTVKKLFCHLASVGAAPLYFINLAQKPPSEGGGGGGPGFDVDAWNAEQVKMRQDKPVEEIMQEFRDSHAGGIKVLESAADDVMARQIRSFQGGTAPAIDVIEMSGSGHEMGHLDDIERALGRS
jgi:pheromone shutdown protein TraB